MAEALSSHYNVKIIGFTFEQLGSQIWEPLREGPIPVISYHGDNYPDFDRFLQTLAPTIESDIILVCKPRMPSLQLGLLMKKFWNRPLILDIDDYEQAFFNDRAKYQVKDLKKPYSRIWTDMAETLIPCADHILVSNHTLQEKYGGTVIPHARNEQIFNPDLYSGTERRKELGISEDDKIILFLGSPRRHKGLFELLKAIKACGDARYKLCIMGAFNDKDLEEELYSLGEEHLLTFSNQPFENAAKNMSIADLVCLLQDPDDEISNYQLPAKAVDAIAMGVPVLAFRVPPLEPLISQGIIIPTTRENLASDIDRLLKNSAEFKAKQLAGREVFLNEYSYSAISQKMDRVIKASMQNPVETPENVFAFFDLTKRVFEEYLRTDDLSTRFKKKKQEYEDKLQKKEANVETLKASLNNSRKENDRLMRILAEIQNSSSWKLTIPLRLASYYSSRLLGKKNRYSLKQIIGKKPLYPLNGSTNRQHDNDKD